MARVSTKRTAERGGHSPTDTHRHHAARRGRPPKEHARTSRLTGVFTLSESHQVRQFARTHKISVASAICHLCAATLVIRRRKAT